MFYLGAQAQLLQRGVAVLGDVSAALEAAAGVGSARELLAAAEERAALAAAVKVRRATQCCAPASRRGDVCG